MSSPVAKQVVHQIERYLAGQQSVTQLRNWLLANAWNSSTRSDPRIDALVRRALGALLLFQQNDLSRQELQQQLRDTVLAAEAPARRRRSRGRQAKVYVLGASHDAHDVPITPRQALSATVVEWTYVAGDHGGAVAVLTRTAAGEPRTGPPRAGARGFAARRDSAPMGIAPVTG